MKALLQDKVCLVIGATGAVGSAIVRAFAAQGADLAIHYHARREAADELASFVTEQGGRSLCIGGDITHADEVERMVAEAETHFGRIDVLVNSAGTDGDNVLGLMSRAEWDAVIASNLTGTFLCTQAAGRRMLGRKSGSIVNISSVTGLCGQSARTNYGAAKGAVLGLTRALALELGPHGIRVNAVAPATLDAGLGAKVSMIERRVRKSRTPLGRLGRSEDAANAALYLASDLAGHVTGEVLMVTGGEVTWQI